jgi:hypothetical protein
LHLYFAFKSPDRAESEIEPAPLPARIPVNTAI